jgi:hypothetical protein
MNFETTEADSRESIYIGGMFKSSIWNRAINRFSLLGFRPTGGRRAGPRMPKGRMREWHDFEISVFGAPGAHSRAAAGRPVAEREAAAREKAKNGPKPPGKKRARGGGWVRGASRPPKWRRAREARENPFSRPSIRSTFCREKKTPFI